MKAGKITCAIDMWTLGGSDVLLSGLHPFDSVSLAGRPGAAIYSGTSIKSSLVALVYFIVLFYSQDPLCYAFAKDIFLH